MGDYVRPRGFAAGSRGRHRPGGGLKARGGSRLSWGEARLMVLGGVMLGLAIAFGPSLVPEREEAPDRVPHEAWNRAPDPYAESRRSREILERQEGAPTPAVAAEAAPGGGAVTVQGAVDVIDGDTFRWAGQTIRIADIDTPEVRGRCAYESALAARATARMKQLLAQGPFRLHPIDRDTDQYGRKLRIVTRGGRSLGDQLVAEGLARTWTGRRQPWC